MERVWITFMLLLAPLTAVADGATDPEALRVRLCLERLVQSGIDPLRAERPAIPEEGPSVEGRPRLAIARSILTVQAAVDSNRAVLTGEVLPLLSVARNHANLGLRRRALRWYERARLADKEHGYADDIERETAKVAVATADSALIVGRLLELTEREDAPRHADSVALLLHALADRPLSAPILLAARRVEAWPSPRPMGCLRELLRVRERQEDWVAALELYREMLGRHRELDLRGVGETLKGLADTRFLLGEREEAARLYGLYRQNNTGWLSAWSTYQLGVLASTGGRLEQAIAHFRSLCEREDATPWRAEACQRLGQSERLQEIDGRLRPYGRRLFTGREGR